LAGIARNNNSSSSAESTRTRSCHVPCSCHYTTPTDQRFKRIVLRSSCMADHYPWSYKHGLSDVLAAVSAKQAP
jgi:hypothetical protein